MVKSRHKTILLRDRQIAPLRYSGEGVSGTALTFEVRPIKNIEEVTRREVAAARTDDLAALRQSAYAAAEPAPATHAATYLIFLREAVRFAIMLSPEPTGIAKEAAARASPPRNGHFQFNISPHSMLKRRRNRDVLPSRTGHLVFRK
jgi:hypothetical protein